MNYKQIDDIIVFCEKEGVDYEVIDDYQFENAVTTAAIAIDTESVAAHELAKFLSEDLGFRHIKNALGSLWIWY